ncbi:hypothetical protein [Mumia zhuanghuii]|uniref:Uncharacterized protein n=1 Tax=Mumia zhuanghuii TaxID=2585211 RepID=A0A5C4LV19_9ACTN|nr:hypothetical protein [Mumia zhuanghuii]TNC22701.1 hypothetical protein FHE65_35690 [Mumia zhuanghuii]
MQLLELLGQPFLQYYRRLARVRHKLRMAWLELAKAELRWQLLEGPLGHLERMEERSSRQECDGLAVLDDLRLLRRLADAMMVVEYESL